jgi:hypothetical protein
MATRRYYSSIAVDNTVSSSINSSANSVVLSNSPVGYPGSFPYVLALDYNTASEELVLVTAASGTTLTITRAYGGSAATSHNAGAVVRHVIIAQDLTDFQDHVAAGPSGVHGITGAIGTFLGTPTSANLIAAVSDETGSGSLVFGTAPTIAIGINAQTGTTYTPVLADAAKLVTLNNSSAITLTVPSSVFSTGQIVNIQAIGTGQVTVQGDGTSTVTSTPGLKLRTQYSAATLICISTNTFTLVGDLSA